MKKEFKLDFDYKKKHEFSVDINVHSHFIPFVTSA